MKPALLVSQKVMAEFGPRLNKILEGAPRELEMLVLTRDLKLTPGQLAGITAAYYSRDVWEGTVKSAVSPMAGVFWNIVDRAPNLKWLAVFSSGTDHQQYQPHMRRGVRLTTGAGAQAEPVATAAVAGLLALARRLPHWWAAQQKREWAPLRGTELPPDLQGQTAVIVGTGHIGACIARVLHAVGLKTVGIRRNVAPAAHFDDVMPLSALDSLLPTCDWLVLACPLTPETRGLMDARRLALLPPTAGLVNIARGEIVEEQALTDALADQRLRCAYLDVFTTEPLARESRLWHLPNVLISPHNAGASTGTYARGVEIFLRNLDAYLKDQRLENEAVPV
jgi:D-2-hydroxyacid dehydrogenase (NADP+)